MKCIVCINSLGNNEVSVIRFSSEIAICFTEIYTSPKFAIFAFLFIKAPPHKGQVNASRLICSA